MSRCVLWKYFGTDPSTARTPPFRMMYAADLAAVAATLAEHDELLRDELVRKAISSWSPPSSDEAVLWWIFKTFSQRAFIRSVTAASAVPALFLYAYPNCSCILWKFVCCAIAASSEAFASESQQHVQWSWEAGSVVVAAVVATPVSWAAPPDAMYYDLMFIVLLISLWPSLASFSEIPEAIRQSSTNHIPGRPHPTHRRVYTCFFWRLIGCRSDLACQRVVTIVTFLFAAVGPMVDFYSVTQLMQKEQALCAGFLTVCIVVPNCPDMFQTNFFLQFVPSLRAGSLTRDALKHSVRETYWEATPSAVLTVASYMQQDTLGSWTGWNTIDIMFFAYYMLWSIPSAMELANRLAQDAQVARVSDHGFSNRFEQFYTSTVGRWQVWRRSVVVLAVGPCLGWLPYSARLPSFPARGRGRLLGLLRGDHLHLPGGSLMIGTLV